MSKTLIALTILEAAVIVVLALVLLTRADPGVPQDGADAVPHREAQPIGAPVGTSTGGSSAQRGAKEAASGPEPAAMERVALPAERLADSVIGAILWGTVRTLDGGTLTEQLQIGVRCTEPKREEWIRIRDGAYAMLGLVPGKWKVQCKANGYASFEREVEIAAGETRTRLDVVLEPAVVVRVKLLTPQGRPLDAAVRELTKKGELPWTDVLVVATEEPPGPSLPPLTDWSYGVAQWRSAQQYERPKSLPKEFAGELELKRPPPVWVSAVVARMVYDTKSLDPGQREITLTVAPEELKKSLGTLRAQILDGATGQPIARARVYANWQWGGEAPETNEDGRITVGNVRPGTSPIMINAKGYENLQRSVSIEPGKELDLGQIRICKAETLKGTVLDAAGKPAALDIAILDLEASPERHAMGQNGTRSDADGAFTIGGIGRRRYVLRAFDKERGGVAQLLDTTQVMPEEVKLRLQPTGMVKLQRDASGGLAVVVRDARGLPVWQSVLNGKVERDICLPLGQLSVECQDYVRPAVTLPLSVAAQGTVLKLP